MVLHAYNPNTGKANPENCRFEASLGYIERPCPKQTNKSRGIPGALEVPPPLSCTVSADLSSLAGRARGRLTGRGLSLSLSLSHCLLADSSPGCSSPSHLPLFYTEPLSTETAVPTPSGTLSGVQWFFFLKGYKVVPWVAMMGASEAKHIDSHGTSAASYSGPG